LQVAHLLAVPFENLSIHSKQPIVLEDNALFTKIVEHRRGGFCYEANGLFAALLRALGFEVTMLSAGVANASGGFGPDFDHMALMVTLDKRWLRRFIPRAAAAGQARRADTGPSRLPPGFRRGLPDFDAARRG
jgi:arylamine N-acetyltransferase